MPPQPIRSVAVFCGSRTGHDPAHAAASAALGAGLAAAKGDVEAEKELLGAMEAARIDSPRGAFTLSPSHNPVQDIYLREAKGGQNMVIGIAAPALADPGTGCKMSRV